MPRFIRSSLVAGFAATVVAAGVITVAPQAVASAPRLTTASVTLAGSCVGGYGPADLPSCAPVVYTPVGEVQLGLVSHPTGPILQLVGTPPAILQAITGTKTVSLMAVAPKIVEDVAEFGGYASAAVAVVGQQM